MAMSAEQYTGFSMLWPEDMLIIWDRSTDDQPTIGRNENSGMNAWMPARISRSSGGKAAGYCWLATAPANEDKDLTASVRRYDVPHAWQYPGITHACVYLEE
jgi:hypothetical protein